MATMNKQEIEILYQEIGKKIKAIRSTPASLIQTQDELANKVGLSRTSITNIENGRQKLTLHTLLEIVWALGVDLDDILPDGIKNTKIGLPNNITSEEETIIKKMISTGRSED